MPPVVEVTLALDELDSAESFLAEMSSKLDVDISEEAREKFSSELAGMTGWLESDEEVAPGAFGKASIEAMNDLIDGGDPEDDPGPVILLLLRDLLLESVIPELPVGTSAYLRDSSLGEIVLAFAEQSPGKNYSKLV